MKSFFNIEMEKKILGQILIDSNAFVIVSNILSPNDFYDKDNRQIYEVFGDFYADNKPIDVSTISLHFFSNKCGIKASDISGLMNGIISATNIEFHARQIKDLSIRRSMLLDLVRVTKFGSDGSNLLDDFTEQFCSLQDNLLKNFSFNSVIKDFKENIQNTLNYIKENQADAADKKHSIPVTLNSLREFIPNWGNGNLIVVAGRPGMGKTAFALFEALSIAKNFGPVLFFSLEMSSVELTARTFQAESNLSRYDFEHMDASKWEILENSISNIENVNFFIDPTPGVSLLHVKTKIKLLKTRENITAVFIDYIGLMSPPKKFSREQQISEISRKLKEFAKEFDLPIFLVSQLNRAPEKRGDNSFYPRLSDLRDSGAIEQDSDIVIFPFRPEYYYPEDIEAKNVMELIVAKNRNGKTGTAIALSNDTKTNFFDKDIFGQNSIDSFTNHSPF